MKRYAELQVTTNFTFLMGGSHPDELVERAIELGYNKIAITDRNTVAGIVRAHMKARLHDSFKIIPACRLDLQDGPSLLAYPTDIKAWGRLCALLSKGNLRTEKGKCELYRQDVFDHKEGIKFMIVPPGKLNTHFDFEDDFKEHVKIYQQQLGNDLYITMSRSYN